MKNIALLIHDDAGQESRLQVALDVTRALGGHLECIDVMMLPIVAVDIYGGGTDTMVLEEVRKEAAEDRERLRQKLLIEDVPWTIVGSFSTADDALERFGAWADLIVMSARDEKLENRRYVEPLPLKADRPILAVPPACGGLNVAGKALVAWDGSRPCIEAVRAAVPLLQYAGDVALLAINQPDGDFAMTEVASYLSRHGVATELIERTSDTSIADAILGHAKHRGADYIVMGAYSKSRAIEAVFGGVTRSMLLKSEVPLFLAH